MVARKIVACSLVVTACMLGACSDGSGPSSSPTQSVTLSVSAGGLSAAAAPESVTVGGHTLALNKVEVVLRRIRLKRVDGTIDCDGESGSGDSAPSASSGSDDGSGSDDDECENVSVGPMLLDLPLGGGVERLVTVDVDTGTYRRVEFQIKKPESADQAFISANPDFAAISIRATGTFDGQAFVYTTDLNAKQRSGLVPPLVVADGATPTDLTLQVDVGTWFRSGSGQLIDPATGLKGQANDNQVRDNIRRSFRLFCDRDHDGHEDR